MIITSKWKKTLVYVVLAIFTLISLYPFYMMLIMGTYTTYNLADSVSMLPGGHLMENLKTVFGNGFMVFYKNSFYLATATTLLSLVVSSLTGYGISKFKFRGARALTIFVIAAMMIPMQVGMIGYLTEIQWLHLNGTREAIIMFYAANCFGTFWIAQYCRSHVPNEVIESARIDGAGEFRIFVQVVLPYLKPALATLVILQFMWNWNNYLLPLIILTDTQLYPITLGISRLANQYSTNYAAQICALSMGTLPLIAIFICGSKYFIAGLAAGDLKG